MARRIVIVGGPRVGKTTLSGKLIDQYGISTLHTSQDLERLFPANQSAGENWSKSSEYASKWFDEDGDWICEGVQMARGLRKWLIANPGKPLDADIFLLRQPMVPQRDGQKAMMKGVETVFREIEAALTKRGARIHKLKNPDDAIDIFRSGQAGDGEQRKPMLIEYTKEQYDALPPAQQKLCAEKDGKYTFEFETPTDVLGLKKNKDQLLADLAKARNDLKVYEGVDPQKYAELVKAQEDAERAALEGKGQYETLVQQLKDQSAQREKQLVDKHEAEMKAAQEEKKSLATALEEKLIDAEIVSALSKHTKAVELLKPHVKKQTKVLTEDGKYVARVIDKDGNVRIGDAQGTPMTFDQLVEEMKASEVYMRGFDANPAGGGGANNGGSGLALGADLSKLSPVERLKAANKVGAT